MKARYLINVSAATKICRGMGNFVKGIVGSICDQKDIEGYVFVSSCQIDPVLEKKIYEANGRLIVITTPLPIFEQIILPLIILWLSPRVLWSPSNTFPLIKVFGVRYVVTLHDLIFFRKDYKPSSVVQKIGKVYRKMCVSLASSKVDVITSVTMTSLAEISEKLGRSERVDESYVLYNSIAPLPSSIESGVLEKLCIVNESFLYTISGGAPHKNFSFLKESLRKARKEGLQQKLIVTGLGEFSDKDLGIIGTGYISDVEKTALLVGCECFVFASLQEGFGIPVLEAMQVCPRLLLSDIGVFHEVAGEYATYFDPLDEDFLCKYAQGDFVFNVSSDLERQRYINEKFNSNRSVEKLKLILEK